MFTLVTVSQEEEDRKIHFTQLGLHMTQIEKITNKRVNLQSNQVKRTHQEFINEFIIQKLNLLLVVDFRLISAFLHV